MSIQCQTDIQNLPIGTRLIVTFGSNRLYGNTSLVEMPDIVDEQEVLQSTTSELVLRRRNETIHRLAFDDLHTVWHYTDTGFRVTFSDGSWADYRIANV